MGLCGWRWALGVGEYVFLSVIISKQSVSVGRLSNQRGHVCQRRMRCVWNMLNSNTKLLTFCDHDSMMYKSLIR
jgi:hypothetical protein